jgi:hypothetical protein
MKIIKSGLFKIGQQKKGDDDLIKEYPESFLKVKSGQQTYKEYGYDRSLKNRGNCTSLRIYQRKIYEIFKDESKKDQKKQREIKLPHRVKLQELKSQNEEYQKQIEDIENKKKPEILSKIDNLQTKIHDIKENPQQIVQDRPSKISLICIFLPNPDTDSCPFRTVILAQTGH